MFPEEDKQGNIDRKHNVSAKMFPSLHKGLDFKIIATRLFMILPLIHFKILKKYLKDSLKEYAYDAKKNPQGYESTFNL